MKALLLAFLLISCNTSAADFPSKEVDRTGVPGNLKQRAKSKEECVKKLAEAALQQMQIKGLHLVATHDQVRRVNRLMKTEPGRNLDVVYKDEHGKQFPGSMRVRFFPVKDGVACRPNWVDVADGEDGNTYRWEEGGKDQGSVKYVRLMVDEEQPKTLGQLCAKDPACLAQAQTSMGLQSTALGMVPSALPSTSVPAATLTGTPADAGR